MGNLLAQGLFAMLGLGGLWYQLQTGKCLKRARDGGLQTRENAPAEYWMSVLVTVMFTIVAFGFLGTSLSGSVG